MINHYSAFLFIHNLKCRYYYIFVFRIYIFLYFIHFSGVLFGFLQYVVFVQRTRHGLLVGVEPAQALYVEIAHKGFRAKGFRKVFSRRQRPARCRSVPGCGSRAGTRPIPGRGRGPSHPPPPSCGSPSCRPAAASGPARRARRCGSPAFRRPDRDRSPISVRPNC